MSKDNFETDNPQNKILTAEDVDGSYNGSLPNRFHSSYVNIGERTMEFSSDSRSDGETKSKLYSVSLSLQLFRFVLILTPDTRICLFFLLCFSLVQSRP